MKQQANYVELQVYIDHGKRPENRSAAPEGQIAHPAHYNRLAIWILDSNKSKLHSGSLHNPLHVETRIPTLQ